MELGDDIMDHLLKCDALCMRLAAVGDEIKSDEKMMILLGAYSLNTVRGQGYRRT